MSAASATGQCNIRSLARLVGISWSLPLVRPMASGRLVEGRSVERRLRFSFFPCRTAVGRMRVCHVSGKGTALYTAAVRQHVARKRLVTAGVTHAGAPEAGCLVGPPPFGPFNACPRRQKARSPRYSTVRSMVAVPPAFAPTVLPKIGPRTAHHVV